MSILMEDSGYPVPTGEYVERYPSPEEEEAMKLLEAAKQLMEKPTYHIHVTWYPLETFEESLLYRQNRGRHGIYYVWHAYGKGFLPCYIVKASDDGYSGMPLQGFETKRVQFGEISADEQVSESFYDTILDDIVNIFTYSIYVNVHCPKEEKNRLLRHRFSREGFELSAIYEIYADTTTPFGVDRISVHKDSFLSPLPILDVLQNYEKITYSMDL